MPDYSKLNDEIMNRDLPDDVEEDINIAVHPKSRERYELHPLGTAARLAALEAQHAADAEALRMAREALEWTFASEKLPTPPGSVIYPMLLWQECPTGGIRYGFYDASHGLWYDELIPDQPFKTCYRWRRLPLPEDVDALAALPEPPTDAK